MIILGYIAAVLAGWTVLAALGGFSLGFVASRLKAMRARPDVPDGDPDATADDYDDDFAEPTRRITSLPPVPQAVWDDLDEVAYRFYAEGLTR